VTHLFRFNFQTAMPSLRGANGSRECAPDDGLRDEAIYSFLLLHGLPRFARNDGNIQLRDLAARFRASYALRAALEKFRGRRECRAHDAPAALCAK
jgi:hypothetical protein